MTRRPLLGATGLALVFLLSATSAWAGEGLSASADLDGDGRPETIRVTGGEGSTFSLKVGRVTATGTLENGDPDELKLVDVVTSDRFKEIAVHTFGPSDDDEYAVFRYDGKTLVEIGHFSRWPTFVGNGIVYVDNWEGFWKSRQKHVWSESRARFELVPQPFHHVGVDVTVTKPFPLLVTRPVPSGPKPTRVARTKPGTKAHIVLAERPEDARCGDGREDPFSCRWYLVRTGSGLLGWARLSDFMDKVDGLVMAD